MEEKKEQPKEPKKPKTIMDYASILIAVLMVIVVIAVLYVLPTQLPPCGSWKDNQSPAENAARILDENNVTHGALTFTYNETTESLDTYHLTGLVNGTYCRVTMDAYANGTSMAGWTFVRYEPTTRPEPLPSTLFSAPVT